MKLLQDYSFYSVKVIIGAVILVIVTVFTTLQVVAEKLKFKKIRNSEE